MENQTIDFAVNMERKEPKNTSKRKACVFTIVRNENVFLPIWLKYYSKFFNKEDIYVLDHGSDDGSVEKCLKDYGFNALRLNFECYDQQWQVRTAQKKQTELLSRYECVLFTDADELVVPNPKKYSGLDDYISKLKKDSVCCTGYFLIHLREEESPFDLSRLILQQRKYWYPDFHYDKPLLSKKPLEWTVGLHNTSKNTPFRDKNLWLIHLHKMDFDLCWLKHQAVNHSKWSEECIKKGYGVQFWHKTKEEFLDWFEPKDLKKRKWWFFLIAFFGFFRYLLWAFPRVFCLKNSPWHVWNQRKILTITKIPKALIETKLF